MELFYALDRFLFSEVPESYPLRAKIRIKLQVRLQGAGGAVGVSMFTSSGRLNCMPPLPMLLQASRAGLCWDLCQTMASLLACVLYVLATYGYDYTGGAVEWVLTGFFTVDFILFLYAAEYRCGAGANPPCRH